MVNAPPDLNEDMDMVEERPSSPTWKHLFIDQSTKNGGEQNKEPRVPISSGELKKQFRRIHCKLQLYTSPRSYKHRNDLCVPFSITEVPVKSSNDLHGFHLKRSSNSSPSIFFSKPQGSIEVQVQIVHFNEALFVKFWRKLANSTSGYQYYPSSAAEYFLYQARVGITWREEELGVGEDRVIEKEEAERRREISFVDLMLSNPKLMDWHEIISPFPLDKLLPFPSGSVDDSKAKVMLDFDFIPLPHKISADEDDGDLASFLSGAAGADAHKTPTTGNEPTSSSPIDLELETAESEVETLGKLSTVQYGSTEVQSQEMGKIPSAIMDVEEADTFTEFPASSDGQLGEKKGPSPLTSYEADDEEESCELP